jgi:replicative DNA helicase
MNPTKLPPHNIEAEQSLLCSFLLGNNPEQAVQSLDSSDFYNANHQNIWNAIYSLYKNKDPIGSVEIAAELTSMGKLEQSGGATYLAKLMDIPQAIDIQHTSKIIKACSIRRKMIAVASQIEKRAYDDTVDVGNLVEGTKLGIESIISGDGFRSKTRNLAQEIKDWVCLQEGSFCLQTVYSCLQLSTRDEKKNVSIILKRLSEGENKIITKNTKTPNISFLIIKISSNNFRRYVIKSTAECLPLTKIKN